MEDTRIHPKITKWQFIKLHSEWSSFCILPFKVILTEVNTDINCMHQVTG